MNNSSLLSRPLQTCLPLLLATLAITVIAQPPAPADPGWPRVFKQGSQQLTVYQPQVDYWKGYTNLHFRCAIAVKGVLKQEKFGVAEVDALTVTDHSARIVALVPLKRELRFANVPESDLTRLRQAVDQLKPPTQTVTLSLDRIIAYLDPAQQPAQLPVHVNLDPPKIFSSTTPAILVIFMGEPQFKPVETNRTDLLFALNTNWDVLCDVASQRYYLLYGDGWLTTSDLKQGPWVPAPGLPPSLYTLPANENWAEARARLPGKPAPVAPTVFVTTEPAELILTEGTPTYQAIRGTRLLRVSNTASVLFLNNGDTKHYFLVAGRWFSSASLQGPWSAASMNLPADFAQIPEDDASAFVKASVPGTREAKDAVLLASIPSTTTVDLTNAPPPVTYSGTPQFVSIPSTTVQYAVNTPNQVFLVNGGYYCCAEGVWYSAKSPTGPWACCTTVPPAIYTIPPTNPNYNVTYVTVQSATPTTVVYSQTAGYSGEYVAATGVVMFGMGMLIGAAIADHHDYYYPSPCHYSYGCGAVYHSGYGGYYASTHVSYGPYGGAGRTASYNPYTGTYARSSYAYGPYGSASRSAAFNPYTGSSAGRAAAYNPTTGRGVEGGYVSGTYGSAAGIRTTGGTGAAAWDTARGQGAVVKTKAGDIYAGNGDTVYKRDANGNWSQNSGNGWENPAKPQRQVSPSATPRLASGRPSSSNQSAPLSRGPTATTSNASGSWSQNRTSLESQAQARQYGNRQATSTSRLQTSPSSFRGQSSSGSRSINRRR